MINTLDDIILAVDTVVDSIPQIPDATNFWMVRSKQGVFYNEYVAGSYIAIGWNSLTKDILSGNRDDDYYKQILKDNNYPDKMPGTALNKCRRFIEEITVWRYCNDRWKIWNRICHHWRLFWTWIKHHNGRKRIGNPYPNRNWNIFGFELSLQKTKTYFNYIKSWFEFCTSHGIQMFGI